MTTDADILAAWDRHRQSGKSIEAAVIATVRDMLPAERAADKCGRCGHGPQLHALGPNRRCAAQGCPCAFWMERIAAKP